MRTKKDWKREKVLTIRGAGYSVGWQGNKIFQISEYFCLKRKKRTFSASLDFIFIEKLIFMRRFLAHEFLFLHPCFLLFFQSNGLYSSANRRGAISEVGEEGRNSREGSVGKKRRGDEEIKARKKSRGTEKNGRRI